MTKTVFMIHGMWGTGDQWSNYRAFFESKGYQVVTPTLRHHVVGQPPDPALGRLGLEDYTDDLEQEIRALSEEPILIGHSMGGLLVQKLLARGIGKAGICLTPAAPRGIIALTPSVIKSFRRILMTWGFWRKPTYPTFEEAWYSVYNLLGEAEARAEYARLTHESGWVTYEIAFSLIDGNRAAEVDTNKIKCPMLVVGCAKDRITPASVIRKIAAKYKEKCQYKEFPNHAHWVLGGEGWEEVAGYCHEWIENKVTIESQ